MAVDEDGKLVDGQHRLQAVVRLGKPVSFRIEHGVPPEFAEVIDTGMKRSLSHTLQMRGFANSSTLAAALKMVHVYSLDKRFKMHALRKDPQTNLSLRIFLEKRVPDLPESVRKMQRLAGKMARLFPVSLAATLHYLFSKEDVEAADYFFETLAKGASDLGEGDPVFALREQLIKQSRRPHGMKMSRHMYMALAIKAWNALQDGHQVMNLRWRTAGPQAEQFPLISTNSGKPIEV